MISRIADTAKSDTDAADAARGDRARDGVDDDTHPAKTQAASHPPARPSQQSLPIDDPTGDYLFCDYLFSDAATLGADGADATQIAKVVEDTDPIVEVGSKVTVEKLSDKGGKMMFTIVDRQNDPDNGLVGSHTPLGQAHALDHPPAAAVPRAGNDTRSSSLRVG